MPYTASRRLQHMSGRKMSKYMLLRRAKRMCSEISSKLSILESRLMRSRLHQV